jgi:hypothetical protein
MASAASASCLARSRPSADGARPPTGLSVRQRDGHPAEVLHAECGQRPLLFLRGFVGVAGRQFREALRLLRKLSA